VSCPPCTGTQPRSACSAVRRYSHLRPPPPPHRLATPTGHPKYLPPRISPRAEGVRPQMARRYHDGAPNRRRLWAHSCRRRVVCLESAPPSPSFMTLSGRMGREKAPVLRTCLYAIDGDDQDPISVTAIVHQQFCTKGMKACLSAVHSYRRNTLSHGGRHVAG